MPSKSAVNDRSASASSYTSMRTSLTLEGVKLHRFASVLPEQFLTEAARHHDAVLAADQRMVISCLGDDLAGFVHDVSHVPSVLLLSAPLSERSKTVATMASHFA
jgi:hypothetical protein